MGIIDKAKVEEAKLEVKADELVGKLQEEKHTVRIIASVVAVIVTILIALSFFG